ncbi:sodium- and chloride-dependent GABA transporter 2-like isoform X3 [Tachypleus tridentatus]|uniref:sodium- and chloride-dependent GABA transporter 2-like isoform X3 n=1 Tax=Tachypleus tridentatus TaxID=6853 RepID=UPI003FD4C344
MFANRDSLRHPSKQATSYLRFIVTTVLLRLKRIVCKAIKDGNFVVCDSRVVSIVTSVSYKVELVKHDSSSKREMGAFLIPYFICIITGGIPMFFLEIALGQYTSQGGITVWNICPFFKGVGFGTTVICCLSNIYYIIILAWALLYFFHSLNSHLPWASCQNQWNTPHCLVHHVPCENLNITNQTSKDFLHIRNTSSNGSIENVDPATEFWERKVLRISSGIEEIGDVNWDLALCLLLGWIMCYFCIWKGVKSTGKVVYFTATFPYLVLTILLIRGVTLPGALDGLYFYLMPDFSRLADGQVWIDAGTQIFYSYAVAFGAMTALGSYNTFHNNFYKQCIFVACCNSGTSLYAGFAIFCILGFMSKESGIPISKVAESGPGLAFIAYPKAIAEMPLAPIWATIFFLMIIMLGLDSQFVCVEGVITAIVDSFPHVLRKGYRRELFTATYCFAAFLVGLCMVTEGGMYVFQIFDYYSASGMTLLWFCFFECFVISWIYGVNRFYGNIRDMLGFSIGPWLQWCWCFFTPLMTSGIFLFSLITYTPLTYNRSYHYPLWAIATGWILALSSMLCIPLYSLYKFNTVSGSFSQRWKILTSPSLTPSLKRHQENVPLQSVGNCDVTLPVSPHSQVMEEKQPELSMT